MTDTKSNLVIVGAGFSANAGLPLASNFTPALLRTAGLRKKGPSRAQIEFLEGFVRTVFAEGAAVDADGWPELEDILTFVDLAANSGHHLGPGYSAAELRTVRRTIITRMIRMLDQRRRRGDRRKRAGWRQLQKFFAAFDATDTAVLSMNWDDVFERGIEASQGIADFDYGGAALPYRFEDDRLVRHHPAAPPLTILKPHGSVNWLYCDACRRTFSVPPEQTETVARNIYGRKDWKVVSRKLGRKVLPAVEKTPCPRCRGKSLGTRFATFSYRKALDFPMHSASWRTAERLLQQAADWVFIGYSMPTADFEFKHMLKRVQLTERHRPSITVITKGDASGDTEKRYLRLFGDVGGSRHLFDNGLDAPARAHLRRLGVLKA